MKFPIVGAILTLLGGLPGCSHRREWGYYPSGGLGLFLAIPVIPLSLGRT